MPDGRQKYVPPSIDQTAFNCPHCGVLTTQGWFFAHGDKMGKGKTPPILKKEEVTIDKIMADLQIDDEKARVIFDSQTRLASGHPFFSRKLTRGDAQLENAYFSQCHHCERPSIWIYNRLIWPQNGEAPPPNPDLPDDILADYREAGAILYLSPRGAAALLRLALQKLCKHLGGKGDNIDTDIRLFVKEKGLDPSVQRALDIVRVVGNNAVHPGKLDISDDRATAVSLFDLVNFIVEDTISRPKRIGDLYDRLPEGARAEIARKDQASKEA